MADSDSSKLTKKGIINTYKMRPTKGMHSVKILFCCSFTITRTEAISEVVYNVKVNTVLKRECIGLAIQLCMFSPINIAT